MIEMCAADQEMDHQSVVLVHIVKYILHRLFYIKIIYFNVK